MMNHTVLTVFDDMDTINEPVIALPILGRVSFRQIGIIIGLAVLLPMMIYSVGSESILESFPDAVFSIGSVGGKIGVTWDLIIALVPVSLGLALGIPRPRLVPMDKLVIILFLFMINHTSIKVPKVKTKHAKSKFAGFAQKEFTISGPPKKSTYSISVTDPTIPKSVTITLYDLKGNPMRNRLARTYVDDELISSITTDSDGVMGMTFVPGSVGVKKLQITVDGIAEPVVDAMLDVCKNI